MATSLLQDKTWNSDGAGVPSLSDPSKTDNPLFTPLESFAQLTVTVLHKALPPFTVTPASLPVHRTFPLVSATPLPVKVVQSPTAFHPAQAHSSRSSPGCPVPRECA